MITPEITGTVVALQSRLIREFSSETPDHRLVLREKNDGLDAVPLETLGLTKREAEVLLWVKSG